MKRINKQLKAPTKEHRKKPQRRKTANTERKNNTPSTLKDKFKIRQKLKETFKGEN